MKIEKLRKKLSAVFSVIFISVFCVSIVFMSVYTIIGDKTPYSYYENRLRSAAPEYTLQGLLSGSLMTDIETYTKDYAALRNRILRIYTGINLNVLKRPVVNGIVITDDALLAYNEPEVINYEKIETSAERVSSNLKSHSEEVLSYGGYFCYVAIPCQYVFFEDSYPWYLNSRAEYTAASSAALFSKLKEKGVSYIDMREVFNSIGDNPEFSSTVDNHYGIIGAYETYRAMMDRIIADSSFRPDVLEKGEFTVEEIPNNYLGSRSRKLLGMIGSDEKLKIIEPIEQIPFDRYDNDSEEAIHNVYSITNDPEASVLYSVYMGGDVAKTVIKTYREELPSILIYGDSFTNAVECIAYTGFDTMYSFDFRSYDDKPLSEIIDEYKPDVVFCLRDYESFLNEKSNGR